MKSVSLLGNTLRASGLSALACLALGMSVPAHAEYPALITQANVLDRLQIEELFERFLLVLESPKVADDLPDYFAEDGVLQLNDQVTSGKQAIRDMLKKQASTPPPPLPGKFHLMITNLRVTFEGNTAKAESTWTGVMNDSVWAPPRFIEQGLYIDTLVKEKGHWVFKKRVVISHSGRNPPPPAPVAPY